MDRFQIFLSDRFNRSSGKTPNAVVPLVCCNSPFVCITSFFRLWDTQGTAGPLSHPRRFSAHAGFTLIELSITLAVAAVLLSLAVPNIGTFVRNNRITTETNTLVAHINLARSEAAKRNVVVALCRKDITKLAPTCGGAVAKGWTDGWLVYATSLTSAAAFIAAPDYNPARIPPDTLLRDETTIANGITVTSNVAGDQLIGYLPNGQLTAAAAGTFRYSVCDDRKEDYGKRIEILGTGRPSLAKTAVGATTDCTPD